MPSATRKMNAKVGSDVSTPGVADHEADEQDREPEGAEERQDHATRSAPAGRRSPAAGSPGSAAITTSASGTIILMSRADAWS